MGFEAISKSWELGQSHATIYCWIKALVKFGSCQHQNINFWSKGVIKLALNEKVFFFTIYFFLFFASMSSRVFPQAPHDQKILECDSIN